MTIARKFQKQPVSGGGGGGPASIVATTTGSAKSTSWSCSLPAGSGNLFVVAMTWRDGATPVSITSANWTEMDKTTSDGNNQMSAVLGFCPAASAGSNVAFSMDSDREATAIAMLIDGWDGVTSPVGTIHKHGTSKTFNPNPPSQAFGWAAPTLALAGLGFRDESTVNANPSGFAYLKDIARSGAAWNYLTSGVIASGSPVDPDAFVCAADKEACAYTIVIPGT